MTFQIPDVLQTELPSFVLPTLTLKQRSRLLQRAEQVLVHHHQMLTKSGRNILHYTLQRKRKHVRFNHYPQGDRIDLKTGSQYFYHCHREDESLEEHGHFHCFLRLKAIPKHIKPKALPDWNKYEDNPMTHLIAISMNRLGQPIRLFTVNRWVTQEIWYSARNMQRLLKQFDMTLTDDPYWMVLDEWVEGMLHLFAPQIAWLHQQRDVKIAAFKRENVKKNVYEDSNLEELSSIDINLSAQIQWLMGETTV